MKNNMQLKVKLEKIKMLEKWKLCQKIELECE